MPDSGSGATAVLIVEDETIVALDMRTRLEMMGYRVVGVAATGETALRAVRDASPDLVLMDIKLKGQMDGVQAAEGIKAFADLPVVFVTAFTDEGTLARVKAMSPYGYVVKPYHERELRITIELALVKYRYERELRVALDRAEESDRAKTRFLSNVSHELKTPLNAIIGFTDLALSLAEGQELREYVALASRSARKLESIINTLLDYTKMESGALIPVYADFDFEDFLLRCWEPFAADAYSKGLSVRLWLDPDLPLAVRGDSGKLGTVVRNLMDNAVKYTETGHVLLEALRADDGLVIRVSDSGVGIPADQRHRLFRRFTQMDDSMTRAVGGLGIGLSLAKGMAELMGGRLGIDESMEEGSAFHVTLPLDASSRPAYPAGTAPFRGARLGVISQPGGVSADLERWAGRLDLSVAPCDPGTALPGCFDVVVAESAPWVRLDEGARAAAAATAGGMERVLVLAPPTEGYVGPHGGEPARLSYPLTLAALKAALEALAPAAAPDRHPAAEPAVADLASGAPDAGYAKSFDDALRDAGDSDAGGLRAFAEAAVGALDADDLAAFERLAKQKYDEWSAGGRGACARLALAMLMDARRGPGAWEADFRNAVSALGGSSGR